MICRTLHLLFGRPRRWVLLAALVAGLAGAQAQTRFDYSVGRVVTDGGAIGISDSRTVSGVSGLITDVNVYLTLSADPDGFNGDLYVTLAHDSGFCVLLNRVGRRADGSPDGPFGYGDPGINVKLDDGASNGDVHNYRVALFGSHTGGFLEGPLTGTWEPDARNVDPGSVLDSSGRGSFLSVFGGTPANGTWTLFAADLSGGGQTRLDSWGLELSANTPPTVSDVPNQTVSENGNLTVPFTVGDAETAAGNLAISFLSSNPALIDASALVASGNGAERTVLITPSAQQSGQTTITIRVSDGAGISQDTFVVTVTPVNQAPTISVVADQTLAEDDQTAPLSFTIGDRETPVENLRVTTASSNPTLIPEANIVVTGTGLERFVQVTPGGHQSGSARVTLTVFDGVLAESSSFLVTVTPVNDSPTLSPVANVTINEDTPAGPIAFSVTDIESLPFLLMVTATSSNTNLVPQSGITLGGTNTERTLIIIPATNQSGTATIILTVSDGLLTAQQQFTLTVTPVNDPPSISTINGQSMDEDSVLTVAFQVSDEETPASNLVLRATSSQPQVIPGSALTLSGESIARAVEIGVVPNASGGSVITLEVVDADGATGQVAFAVTVLPVNDLPLISEIAPQSTLENRSLGPIGFTVQDQETPVGNLTITVESSRTELVPAGNIQVIGEGVERGLLIQPATNQTGTATITITVNDGEAALSRSFPLTVAPVAPIIISGSAPQRVTGGDSVVLEVSAAGTAPLTYFWSFNGQPLPQATTASITLTNVQPIQSGPYQVTVSNVAGAVTFETSLIVDPPRGPFHLAAIRNPSGPGIRVQLLGAGPGNYELEISTNLWEWVPAGVTTVTEDPAVLVDPTATSADLRFYRVRRR
jgi:hypothetical protein